jgi:hypothetical protein
MRRAWMRATPTLATECISEAITFLESAPANFHGTSANSENRSPIEAGNNRMLFPPLGACNRNNSCEVMRYPCCDANVFWVSGRMRLRAAVFARFDAARHRLDWQGTTASNSASETSHFRFCLGTSQIIDRARHLFRIAEFTAKVSSYLRHA